MKYYNIKVWKNMCGKVRWLVEKFVCGFRLMNELHMFVLKKFCVCLYGDCFFYGFILFHTTNSQNISSTQIFTLYSRCLYQIIQIKCSLTCWYLKHVRYGYDPLSFLISASHYFWYVCLDCIIDIESFLNLLSVVFTS